MTLCLLEELKQDVKTELLKIFKNKTQKLLKMKIRTFKCNLKVVKQNQNIMLICLRKNWKKWIMKKFNKKKRRKN